MPSAVAFLHGTILNREVLTTAFAGTDAVVHLAAVSSVPASIRDPVGTFVVNEIGSQFILDAARRAGVGFVVVASSAAVYGRHPHPPISESAAPHPISPYGESKLRSEERAFSMSRSGDLATLVLRLFNVYGPGQRLASGCGAVLPSFIGAALRNDPLTINGDGRQTRDLVYVDDLCRVIVDALFRNVHAETPVNVGNGTGVSIRTLADMLGEVLGQPLQCIAGSPRPGDLRDSWADNSLLRRLFPAYSPIPLKDGLTATVDWFRSASAPQLAATQPVGAHR